MIDFLRDRCLSDPVAEYHASGLGLSEQAAQIGFAIGAFVAATGAMFCDHPYLGLRKLIGRIQDRYGAIVRPVWHLPVDCRLAKIFIKSTSTVVWTAPFNLAFLSVAAVLTMWVAIPFAATVYGVDFNVGLFTWWQGGLGELAVIMAGWAPTTNTPCWVPSAVAMFISYSAHGHHPAHPVMLTGSLSM